MGMLLSVCIWLSSHCFLKVSYSNTQSVVQLFRETASNFTFTFEKSCRQAYGTLTLAVLAVEKNIDTWKNIVCCL